MDPPTHIELGLEVTPIQLEFVRQFLHSVQIPFYQEPPRPWASLEDLEYQCEGK